MRPKFRQALMTFALMAALAGFGAAFAQSVTVAIKGEPNTLDPHRVIGRQSEAFLANIFDGLTSRDLDGAIQPGLAVSWEQIEPTVWRFNLREGVTFHNGEVFDATSVKFTLDRAGNPDQPATTWSQLNTIASVTIVDDYTVDVETSSPDLLLPSRLGDLFGGMLPPQYTAEAGDDFGNAPVGTGPFTLEEWVRNERMVLKANPNYWRGPAAIDEIVVRPISEDASRVAALVAGEVDVIEGLPHVMIDLVEQLPNVRAERAAASRVFFIAIDPTAGPLADQRVRQALNYAIDREAIIEQLFEGYGRPSATVVSAQAFGFDPSVEPYPYDPEKARELLAEAGYGDGLSIEFDYFTGSVADHYSLSQAVAGYWADLGIDVTQNVYEIGVFQEKRGADQAAPLYVYSLGDVFLEPFWLVEWLGAGDMSRRYDNPEVMALIEQIRGTVDDEARAELYAQVQQMMREDAQHVFLFQVDTIWGVNERIDFTLRADEVPWFYPMQIAR
jgi:peptide/nickel transport system substrate-binding protein